MMLQVQGEEHHLFREEEENLLEGVMIRVVVPFRNELPAKIITCQNANQPEIQPFPQLLATADLYQCP